METIKLNMPHENGPHGWYVTATNGYLNKDGTIHSSCVTDTGSETPSYDQQGSGYWQTYEQALEAKHRYENYIAIPESQLVVYQLENPTQESIGWCVYTKDTGYYSYALSENNTIFHTVYRKHWDTENAALFAKLCYERKVKHLQK